MNRGRPTTISKTADPLADVTVALDPRARERRRRLQLRCRSRRGATVVASIIVLFATRAAKADEPRAQPPVVVIAPPPPEPDPPPPPPAPPTAHEEKPAHPVHRFEMSIAGTAIPMALSDVRFVGTGVPKGGVKRTTFSHPGRDVGLRQPTFWGGELSIGYRHTHFGVFLLGSIATIGRPDAKPADIHAAAQLGANDVTAYGGGIEAFGAVPIGPVTLSLGAAAGMRGLTAPLTGFEPTTCSRRTKRGRYTYPCAETASTNVQPWVQPRLRFDVSIGESRAIFVGGFVGMDVLADGARLGGVVLGFRL